MTFFFSVIVAGLLIYWFFNRAENENDHPSAHNNVPRAVNSNPQRVGSNQNVGTGMMVYFANDAYHLSDNEYRFSYRRVGNGWRAYILKCPTINGRTASCHRLSDGGGSYICWDREISTLKEMQNVARRWADNNQKYIATGIGF